MNWCGIIPLTMLNTALNMENSVIAYISHSLAATGPTQCVN